TDKRFRTFGFGPLSETLAANASPMLKLALESYAQGVNAYISSLDEQSLPREFGILKYKPQPWRPSDSLAVAKLFSYGLSTTYQTDLMRAALSGVPREKRDDLLIEVSPLDVVEVGVDRGDRSGRVTRRDPPTPVRQVTDETVAAAKTELDKVDRILTRIGFSSESALASNNWVVSGKHTASGKPLLANDPHLRATVPSVWYITHLDGPGMRVAGVASPGIPGIVIGHNEFIA